jgi:prepilin-type N-terminal cleavage/methylation domain-containing protein
MRRTIRTDRRGDTLIEVMLSISIFAMVALLTINMMNDGINTAQRTLETEMARNEIDAQAEAIRYIHNNYVAERNMNTSQFRLAWQKIISKAMKPSQLKDNIDASDADKSVYFDINNMESCEVPYGANRHLDRYQAFIVNPRLLIPNNFSDDSQSQINNQNVRYLNNDYEDLLGHMLIYYRKDASNYSAEFSPPSLYPRIIYKALSSPSAGSNEDLMYENGNSAIIYNDVKSVEGLWVNVAGNSERNPKRSDYYDFYIRTCWHSAGSRAPSTITTVVRLYNPEVME